MLIALDANEIKLFVQIGALGLILWLETIVPLFQKRKGHLRHDLRNLGIGLFNGFFIAITFSFLIAFVIEKAQEREFGLMMVLNLPFWLETVIALILFDLWMYLWHRMNHRIPFLWLFHRMHHSDDRVDVTSALRFHTGELIFSSILRLAIVPLLGLNLPQLILYEICLQPVILFHHSNVALPEKIDRIFRAFIVTPNMHRVHHSQVKGETNSNYASILSIWDRIFKSFCFRKDIPNIDFGLPEFPEEEWQTIPGMLKTPFK